MRLDRHAIAPTLLALASLTVATAEAADEKNVKLVAAVTEVRTAGVALWEWFRATGRPVPALEGGENVGLVDVSPAAPVDVAAARETGLPAPVVERLQGLDPWGHPYEVRLGDGSQAPTLVVRSAGANGRFEGDQYTVGTFAIGAADDDVVWADGYFLRWPGGR